MIDYFGLADVHARKLCVLRDIKGFTMMELLAVLAIVAISLSVASPLALGFLAKMKVNMAAGLMQEFVQLAREEARTRYSRVALCAGGPEMACKGDGRHWQDGWTLFYSRFNGSATVLEPIAQYAMEGLRINTVPDSQFDSGQFIFNGQGVLLMGENVSQGFLTFCHPLTEHMVKFEVNPIGQKTLHDEGEMLRRPGGCL